MKNPTGDEILASSSIWLAFLLNILPGLGAGYIYQRRWKAYWITLFISVIWLFFSLSLQTGIDTTDPAPSRFEDIGFYGLILIAATTSCEAAWETKKTRKSLDN